MIPPRGWRTDEDFIDVVWHTPGKARKPMGDLGDGGVERYYPSKEEVVTQQLMEDRAAFKKRYQVKDSGERKVFDSGMQRDVTEGKIDYALVFDGPMFERWADHMNKGARKYEKRNWMKAAGKEEYDRFKESALRHFIQWFRGETDEDHASAVFFNINGAEYVKEKGDVK